MQRKHLLQDDGESNEESGSGGTRAVSPVIGVILMVAITVILAAVIATFVLGIGDSTEATPTAQFSIDFGDDTITHEGGDSIDSARLDVSVDGTSEEWGGSGDVTAGGEYDLTSHGNYSSGDSDKDVRVIWISESGDSTQTLVSQTSP